MKPSSSAGSTSLERSVRNDEPIPRRLARVPAAQDELLMKEESWYSHLIQGSVGTCNLPPDVLSQVVYFHTSKIPPPPGQKPPPTSSTSLPNGSGSTENHIQEGQEREPDQEEEKEEEDSSGDDEDDSDEGSIVSWSPTPERDSRPRLPTTNSTDPDEEIRSSPPVRHGHEDATQGTPSTGGERSRIFYTQPPLSSPPMPSELSSVVLSAKPGIPQQTPAPANTPRRTTSRLPFVTLPPSSADTEEELPLEIPGALTYATPPLRKSRQNLADPNQSVFDTPPCGQGHLIKSTYPDPRENAVPFAQLASSRTNALRGEPVRLQPSKSSSANASTPDMELKRGNKRLKPMDFNAPQPGQIVQVENTPASAMLRTKRTAVAQSPATMTSPIASTFPVNKGPLTLRCPAKKAAQVSPRAPEATMPAAMEIEHTGPAQTLASPHGRPAVTEPPPAQIHIAEIAETISRESTEENVEKKRESSTTVDATVQTFAPEVPVSDATAQTSASEPAIDATVQTSASEASVVHATVQTSAASPVDTAVQVHAQGEPAGAARPSTPDMSAFFWNQPFDAFRMAYPTFSGSLGDFVRACLSLRSLYRKSKLPVFLYDDFIRIFCDDYIEYIEGTSDDEPKVALEWYVENVQAPVFNRKIVTPKNLGRVFKVHTDEFESANTDMILSSPGDMRSISRRTSDAASHSRADIQLRPLTKTPPQYRDVSPPARNGTKRKASVLLGVDSLELVDTESHAGSVSPGMLDGRSKRSDAADEAMEPPRKKPTPPTRTFEPAARTASVSSPEFTPAEPILPSREDTASRDGAMMPPPRPPRRPTTDKPKRSEMTSNDHMKERSRVLPPTWGAHEGNGDNATTSPKPRPVSPASTVLTQASGVKKKKRRMPSSAEYAARMAKRMAEGTLATGMSSSAPQPTKRS